MAALSIPHNSYANYPLFSRSYQTLNPKSRLLPLITGKPTKCRPTFSLHRTRAVLSSSPSSSAGIDADIELIIDQATNSSFSELRAAASLRSHSFLVYPPDRSATSTNIHREMHTTMEFKTLQRKISGLEPGYPKVACLVALLPLQSLPNPSTDLDPQFLVHRGAIGDPHWVVGTLDVNYGARLPCEELVGSFPMEEKENGDISRSYLSNVCVARAVRRRGIAQKLLRAAIAMARKSWEVEEVYVHVIADNTPAIELYEKLGFVVEKEETAAMAKKTDRPRRLLLRFQGNKDQ